MYLLLLWVKHDKIIRRLGNAQQSDDSILNQPKYKLDELWTLNSWGIKYFGIRMYHSRSSKGSQLFEKIEYEFSGRASTVEWCHLFIVMFQHQK